MRVIDEDDLNNELGPAKLVRLTVDYDIGNFKLLLEDGRILSLLSTKTQLGAMLFPSEAEYQRRKVDFLQRQVLKQSLGRGVRDELTRVAEEFDVQVGDISTIPPDILKLIIGKLTDALVKAKPTLDETIN